MLIIELDSLIDINEEELRESLSETLKSRFRELLISIKMQLVSLDVFDDNCEHYLLLVNPEFDYGTKSEKESLDSRLKELVEMIFSSQYDSTNIKIHKQ